MAPDQERDGSERAAGARMAGPTAATSSAGVGGGTVAVVVASCPAPAVLQASPTVVASASSVIASASASLSANAAVLASSASSSSSEEEDMALSRAAERQWKRSVSTEMRERLVDGMLEELRRITGQENVHHLRVCAARYESLVWKKSTNAIEYTQKIERRIQSLRRQPSQQEIQVTAATAAQQQLVTPAGRHASSSSSVVASTTTSSLPSSSGTTSRPSSSKRSKHRRSSSSHHRSSSSSSSSSSLTPAARDEQYFARLHIMKAAYRDEVALVFRELCRVNTVIQNSASLRRHESNNLGDFLANLKKIIYLLEQRPDEMHGMIPARKRTLEYLDVVESHIQRKVLPILYRLRHTYSTILRPLVLNYLRNCTRVSRRL